MSVIYKYVIPTPRTGLLSTISMPRNARILTVETVRGKVCVYAIVQRDDEHCNRTFHVVPTGIPFGPLEIPPHRDHLGTVLLREETLVFHVFGCRGPVPVGLTLTGDVS